MPLIVLDSNGNRTDVINEATIGQILNTQASDASKQASRGREKYEIDLTKVLKRADTDLTGHLVDIEYDHKDGYLITSWLTKTKSNGNVHYQYIAIPVEFIEDYYYEDFNANFNDLIGIYDIFVFCDCKSFRYHFSNRDNVENILYKGGREDWKGLINYPVQGLYSVNPDKLGGLCKHLLMIIKSLMGTNWITLRNGINNLIKNNIELYDVLTFQRKDEIEKQEEVISKEVNKLEDTIYDYDKKYDELSKKYDDILVEYNTDINEENIDEKAEVFTNDGLDLLIEIEDVITKLDRFQKEINNIRRKYDEGSSNRETIEVIQEFYDQVYRDLEVMHTELEQYIEEV